MNKIIYLIDNKDFYISIFVGFLLGYILSKGAINVESILTSFLNS